jgi:hypothetical protein
VFTIGCSQARCIARRSSSSCQRRAGRSDFQSGCKLRNITFNSMEANSNVMLQLMNSNRYGEARTAYREVQERHEDIKRIERTLGELAQLFNDVCCSIISLLCICLSTSQMSVLVEQQDEQINVIEEQAAVVEKDTEAGYNSLFILELRETHISPPACNTPKRPWTRQGQRGRRDGSASSYA